MAKSDLACALCGASVRRAFRAPPAELAPDLDLRPGEPTRSTLSQWVQTCSCGVSAPDLTRLPAGAAAAIQGEAYAALRAPHPAGPFLRWARVAGEDGVAGEAMLQAAWAMDDAGPDWAEAGRAARLEAVRLWGPPRTSEAALRQVDVLRRAGAFVPATELAQSMSDLDEGAAAIRDFQLGRIAARDTGRHGFDSVLRPPSRRPHASHGRVTNKQGFWRRVFG